MSKGKQICRDYNIETSSAYYRKDGVFYNYPGSFPATFTDDLGYIQYLNKSEFEEAERRADFTVSVRTNGSRCLNFKKKGISSLSDYKYYPKL